MRRRIDGHWSRNANLGGYTLSGLGQGVGVELSTGASLVDGKVGGFNVGVSAQGSRVTRALSEMCSSKTFALAVTQRMAFTIDPRVAGVRIMGSKISRNGRNGILLAVNSSVVDGNHINHNGLNGIVAGFADVGTYFKQHCRW